MEAGEAALLGQQLTMETTRTMKLVLNAVAQVSGGPVGLPHSGEVGHRGSFSFAPRGGFCA
jgi:hypothetical protein